MSPDYPFSRTLKRVENQYAKLGNTLRRIRQLADENEIAQAFDLSVEMVKQLESITVTGRELPCDTSKPHAMQIVNNTIEQCYNFELGFSAAGWFVLRIPALLPKKSLKANVDYIRVPLYLAMASYFTKVPRVRITDSVIIFRHIYAADTPERRIRDHDNIEVNQVTDIVAMYVLPDDNPKVCDHFYCTDMGNCNSTEVYVVPRSELEIWLKMRMNGCLNHLEIK